MDDYFTKIMLLANYNNTPINLREKIIDISFELRKTMAEFNELGYEISFTLNIPNVEDIENQILQNNF